MTPLKYAECPHCTTTFQPKYYFQDLKMGTTSSIWCIHCDQEFQITVLPDKMYISSLVPEPKYDSFLEDFSQTLAAYYPDICEGKITPNELAQQLTEYFNKNQPKGD
jgi:FPC/CPF motif-containing protein YcgG